MAPGIDGIEAWNEAVCAGAWGGLAARAGEKLRRALDLEHWPAFQRSFGKMIELLHELAEGPDAPGTISFIGGDVHTASIAEVSLGPRQTSRVFQIVCSPFRNPLAPREQRVVKLLSSRASGVAARALARERGRAPAGCDLAPGHARDVRQLGRRADARRAARPRRDPPQRPRGRTTAGRSSACTSTI